MNRSRWLVLAAIALVCLLWPGVAHAADKEYRWDYLNVDIQVLPNADMIIEETHRYAFTKGSFTFAYREIDTSRTEGITDIQVWEGNSIYRPGSGQAGTYSISSEGKRLRITWWYPTTVAGNARTFAIRYRVQGGIRFYQGGDQVFWKAVFPDRDFAVLRSQVTVNLPGAFSPEDLLVASYGVPAQYRIVDGQTVVFEGGRVAPGQELEVRVQFPHGVLQSSAPGWQRQEDALRAYNERYRSLVNVILAMLGLGITVVGVLGALVLWYQKGRDFPVGVMADYLAEPPSDLSPGLAGTLVDERADMQDVVATIVDLARRGFLRMEEEQERGFLGLSSRQDFTFVLQRRKGNLLPYEARVVNGIFGRKSKVKLSSLQNKFYTKLSGIKERIYEEVVKRGYFERSPEKTRQLYLIPGIIALVAALPLGIALSLALSDYADTVFVPFVGLGMTGLAFVIISNFMPRKTEGGSEEAAKWAAFRRYLRDIDKYTDLEEAKELFDQYLPYAVAFGLEKEWIRRFSRVDTPAPVWYIPWMTAGRSSGGATRAGAPSLSGAGGMPSLQGMSTGMATSLQSMSDGLASMLNSAANTFASSPSSSGSGGFSGGGGGGGGGAG